MIYKSLLELIIIMKEMNEENERLRKENKEFKEFDTIKLPYKQKIKNSSEWQVVWRDNFTRKLKSTEFYTENEADNFIIRIERRKK